MCGQVMSHYDWLAETGTHAHTDRDVTMGHRWGEELLWDVILSIWSVFAANMKADPGFVSGYSIEGECAC